MQTEQETQVLADFWCAEYIYTAFSIVTLCTCSFILHCFGRFSFKLFLLGFYSSSLLAKEKWWTRHAALSRSRSNTQKEKNSKADSCAFLHWAQWVNRYPGSPAAICGVSGADVLFIETCLHKANIYLSVLSKFAIHLCCYPAGFHVNSGIFQKKIL